MEAPPDLRLRRPKEAKPKLANEAAPDAAAPRRARAKTEHPKYDVICGVCGAAAQVPFKPIEGRDIFCQPCYRARARVTVPTAEVPATEVAPPPDADGAAVD